MARSSCLAQTPTTVQTRVNAGTLKLSGGSAIEDIRDVFVDASGTLDLNGSSETINRLTGTGTIDNQCWK